MNISLIVAAAKNGAIGFQNKLLWHLPDDFKRFKKITSGHPIIMGRKTYESLGKPLPNRLNIVISRNPDFSASGVEITDSLDSALAIARDAAGYEEIFVIGGGEIYRQAFAKANRIYLTEVHAEPEGDTFFSISDPENWRIFSQVTHPADERHRYSFDYIDFERI